MTPDERRSVAGSVEGSDQGNFRVFDWGQMVLAALIFGSAFLWIALALESIDPRTLAFGRVLLGALTLAGVRRARRTVVREDFLRLGTAAFFGMAAPALLFSLAEERIPSALAGMLISSAPVMTAILTATLTRTFPNLRRVIGLSVGFVGIALLAWPDLSGTGTEVTGVVMVLTAVLCYAIASLMYAPLQQTYGALPVTLWVLAISTVLLAPLGIAGLRHSTPELMPVLALVILGSVGTGAAWALFVAMVGKVGAVRAAVVGYIIPIVALALGVLVLDEHIGAIQVVGVVIVLSGGYLLSRGRAHRDSSRDRARL